MYQQQIEFFWPLTEQIPLDLDYEECERPKIIWETTVLGTNGQVLTIAGGGTSFVTLSAGNMSLDIDTTTIKVKDKPNLCRRTLYKCLGLKWEIK